ncbi:dihydrofolate reductase [Aspergillus affinis]|uniref:dihydrofolate reductase n=1 Tax=Aspergillus affinis TaxID=1070780 RepID=UPI0022FECECF|nr:dihydrofolate reductase [Aspergillus affinis]KAI9038023.1 dihydrofolate reductase [Aspergillus affinis]
MPPSPASHPPLLGGKPLTLIVATTPIPSTSPSQPRTRLGIGLNGTLPWPRIKTDMSFFARVTTRPPASVPGSTNAIVMGRKTYDSVPAGLRPLGKRLSVILSRGGEGGKGGLGERVREDLERKLGKEREQHQQKIQAEAEAQGQAQENTSTSQNKKGGDQPGKQTSAFISTSLPSALETLSQPPSTSGIPKVGHVYIIGGAEIYASSLNLPATQPVRIVMTNVEKLNPAETFECDTFFPVDEELEQERGWRKVSADEVSAWVGEEVTGEWREEGDVRVRMVGYERV